MQFYFQIVIVIQINLIMAMESVLYLDFLNA